MMKLLQESIAKQEEQAEVYKDFDELRKDIVKFIEEHNDAKIICADNPWKLRVGWADENSGKRWEIGISHLKRAVDSKEMEPLRRALQTEEGKTNLVEAFYQLAKLGKK